jgi:hypothetical protein
MATHGIRFRRFALLLILSGAFLDRVAADDATPIDRVEVKVLTRGDSLGTTFYAPSEAEKPFYEKLADDEKQISPLAEYDITKKSGVFVGWFGIVRKIEADEKKKQAVLTVEHKYFDGLTDAHIQAVSFNGSGDFEVVLKGTKTGIKPLSLVRVYGKAQTAKDAALPLIQADFVREWPWGAFTFLSAYGEQRGSEEWRKLNTVPLEKIYDPYPKTVYYVQRLGKPGK